MATKKEKEKTPVANPFVDYKPTHQEVREAMNVFQDIINDGSLKQHYKLRLVAVEAKVKLKPILEKIKEVSTPLDRYKEYQDKQGELLNKHIELDASGSVVLYQDPKCEVMVPPGSDVKSFRFLNYITSKEEYEEAFEKLKKEYKDAIDVENGRPALVEKLLSQEVDLSEYKLTKLGQEYPEKTLDGRFLSTLLLFGIIEPKEV